MTEVFSDLADLSGVAENTLLKVSKVSMQTKMVMKKFVCLTYIWILSLQTG